MKVKECKQGEVVESILFGRPTGNIYRVAGPTGIGISVYAWRNFRQGKVVLSGDLNCRVIGVDEMNLMGYVF